MTTSSPKPDFRSPNEKAIELMNLIPLNSYWYKVQTHNRKENKILSFDKDINQGNDLNIITTHEYYNVYSYTSDRSGGIHNKCVEIKYDDNSWRIYPNGSLYDFNIKDCNEITKEVFEKIEGNFITAFCIVSNYSGALVLLNIDEDTWPVGDEWNKLILDHPNTVFIRRKKVPFSELKIGDKYIFYPTKNVTRMGEILSSTDKDYNVKDRQVTISQNSNMIVSESPEKRDLFVLISELKESTLNESKSELFWILTDEEWDKINFIMDEMKIIMKMSMKCDFRDDEECINFKRQSRLQKTLENESIYNISK